MKKIVEVEACEIEKCGRVSSVLDECPVCQRKICFMCRMRLYDIYYTYTCVDCYENPLVKDILQNALENWRNKRKELLEKLPKINIE